MAMIAAELIRNRSNVASVMKVALKMKNERHSAASTAVLQPPVRQPVVCAGRD